MAFLETSTAAQTKAEHVTAARVLLETIFVLSHEVEMHLTLANRRRKPEWGRALRLRRRADELRSLLKYGQVPERKSR